MLTDKDVIRAVEAVEALPTKYLPSPEREALTLIIKITRQCVEKQIQMAAPPDKRMEHMTEPELSAHLTHQLRFIKRCQSEDTIGSMLIIFQEDKITQYGATINPEDAPKALRELADRIEKRETVKR